MLGYTFATEQEAIESRILCDTYYGYPLDGAVTSHWIDYEFNESENVWFIIFDESVRTILGEPYEI
jgi:hypothetical protein